MAPLVEALKRKYKSPAEAVEALGLDAKLLEAPAMLSQTALVAKGALLAVLSRRMQPGKRVNELALDDILKDVNERNWTKAKRREVAAKVQAKFRPVLAMDEDLRDLPGTLEALPPKPAAPPTAMPGQDNDDLSLIWAWMMANCPPEVIARMKTDLGLQGPPVAPGQNSNGNGNAARDNYDVNNNNGGNYDNNGNGNGNGYRNGNSPSGYNFRGTPPAQDSKIISAEDAFPDLRRIVNGGGSGRPRRPAPAQNHAYSGPSAGEAFPDLLRITRA